MKLFCFYTEDYLPMYEVFASSIRDDFEVIAEKADYQKTEGFGGGAGTWNFKNNFILNAIRSNYGEHIIVCDIDMIFLGEVLPIIKKCVENKKLVFQRELPKRGVNIGFMAFDCGKETEEFWQTVSRRVIEEDVWDQVIVNKLLYVDNYEISWDRFPLEFYSYTLSGRLRLTEGALPDLKGDAAKLEKLGPLVKRNAVLYHANFDGHHPDAMQIKLEQLAAVQAIMSDSTSEE